MVNPYWVFEYVRYPVPAEVDWTVVAAGGAGGAVVAAAGGVVKAGPGEGIVGWVQPENATIQRRIARPATGRSALGPEAGVPENRGIYRHRQAGF